MILNQKQEMYVFQRQSIPTPLLLQQKLNGAIYLQPIAHVSNLQCALGLVHREAHLDDAKDGLFGSMHRRIRAIEQAKLPRRASSVADADT